MNILNSFNTQKKYISGKKKAKSSNRVISEKYQLPSLKATINRQNKYLNSPYLEIISQNRKKNKSLVPNHLKNHKPYSGNPLKFNIKKELNSGINKYHPERDILTANPYIVGYNSQKKNLLIKNNNNLGIMGMNGLFIKHLMYPSYNINANHLVKNKKEWNSSNKMKQNKALYNNYKGIKPSIFNSDDKTNNIFKETKLRTTKQNNLENKIVIVANSKVTKNNNNNNDINFNSSINNQSDDMKKTIAEKEAFNNHKENEETFPLEKHYDLCFVSYAYHEHPNLEHRKDMEDFHYIKALLNKKINCSYFGLFDGHSGKEVGMYLMQNLHKILSQEFKNNNNIENTENIKQIVISSFEKIDKEINEQNFKNETGSTGTVLLLYKDKNSPSGKSILSANVGDSKAYLITKREMKLITKDHKCNDSNEVQRIRDSGGIVFRERVFGTLMLTRSFGDKEMKKYGVLSTPDIFLKNIEDDDLFVIIASDGVWDVVEEDEIFKMAKVKISSNDFSKKIVNLAKERDTHDNISCIVIKLNKTN